MTVIGTSAQTTATAYSNQRKVDRCQNGVLWTLFHPSSNNNVVKAYYSTDNGTSWTESGNAIIWSSSNPTPNYSFFIDVDDYAHVVYKNNADGNIYYRRGTPDAGRTAWTWSAVTTVSTNGSSADYPDVAAHREGTGWVVHVVHSIGLASSCQVRYSDLEISSGGVISLGSFATVNAGTGTIIGNYSFASDTWPSIDFNHTGDGKTVAGGTPHLYVAWSAGKTGTGYGIRFKKAAYSGGSWTWGTEREIDSTRYVVNTNYWVNCLFDGTRVVIPGFLYDGASFDLVLYERDAADTTTTTYVLLDATVADDRLTRGTSSYDESGNVYFIGRSDTPPYPLNLRKWERTITTLESITVIDVDTGGSTSYPSLKRGYSNNLIEFIYTDGTASPYDITYGAISLNTEPNLPTNLAVTSLGTDTTPNFSADISDPETAQQIKARFEVRTLAGTVLGTLDSSFRTGAGTVTAEWADALATGQYQVRAQTIDDAGAESAFTDWLSFSIAQPAPPKDLSLLWNTIGVVPKDLNLLWNITEGNLKDLSLLWDTTAIQGKELTLLWNKKTPWREVTEDSDIWRKVY